MTNSNFEDGMKKLEEYAEKIKSSDTNLEESIKCYEEGMKYYKECKSILDSAKQKIEIYEGEV